MSRLIYFDANWLCNKNVSKFYVNCTSTSNITIWHLHWRQQQNLIESNLDSNNLLTSLYYNSTMEGVYIQCNLSVCLSVCLSVWLSASEHNSSQTDVSIILQFLLNNCLPHIIRSNRNWWPKIKKSLTKMCLKMTKKSESTKMCPKMTKKKSWQKFNVWNVSFWKWVLQIIVMVLK